MCQRLKFQCLDVFRGGSVAARPAHDITVTVVYTMENKGSNGLFVPFSFRITLKRVEMGKLYLALRPN